MVLEMVWTWTHPKVLAKEVDVQFRCSVVRAPLMLQSALEAACTLPGSSNFPQQNHGKSPFIVSFPMKNGAFP